MQFRLSKAPEMMRVRKRTVEHPFGTLKQWMGATHFLTRKLVGVSAEMSFARLQHETSECQRFDEGAVGIKKADFGPCQRLYKQH
jgi:hypothetical protein